MPRKKEAKKEDELCLTSPIDFEMIYSIVNYVQNSKKSIDFHATKQDSLTIDNILRDSQMPYKKSLLKKSVKYAIDPPPEKEIGEDFFIFDDIEDEEVEDGQIF